MKHPFRTIGILLILGILASLGAYAAVFRPMLAAFKNPSCGNVRYFHPAQDGIQNYDLDRKGNGIIWGYDENRHLLAAGWYTANGVSTETILVPAADGINSITVSNPFAKAKVTVQPLICGKVMYVLMIDPVIEPITQQTVPVVPTGTPWIIQPKSPDNNG